MKEVPLTRGHVALVDDEDFDAVSALKWCYDGHGYAVHRFGPGDARRMHRFIMQPRVGLQVDHINGDGLDNRRCNLRVVLPWQNNANQRKTRGTSEFKGVSWRPDLGKWTAHIKSFGIAYYLGVFEDEEEAAQAYDRAAVSLFGAHARLNFPQEMDHE